MKRICRLAHWIGKKLGRQIAAAIIISGIVVCMVTLLASYFILLPPLKSQSVKTAKDVNRQILDQTDYLLSYIMGYSDIVSSSETFMDDFNMFVNNNDERFLKIFEITLNNFTNQINNLRAIRVETDDGRWADSITNLTKEELALLDSEWYKRVREMNISSVSRICHISSKAYDLSVAACSKNYTQYGHKYTLTIFFSVGEIISTTRAFAENNLNDSAWVDARGNLFFSLNNTKWSQNIAAVTQTMPLYKTDAYQTDEGYVFIAPAKNSNWVLISFVSNQMLNKSFEGYFLTVILFFTMFFVILVIALIPLIRRLTRPIHELAEVMKCASTGDLDVVSFISTKNEIGDLSRIFNKMVAEIKNKVIQILHKEEIEHRMQYNLLIGQIDPHFIYNTMNTINYLARKEQCGEIIAVNTALIQILQDRLRIRSGDVLDTLEQEIATVKQYIIIQQYRFAGSDINLVWDVPEHFLKVKIPKNIIQPLVENSLFYGLTNDSTNHIHGTIRVCVNSENGRLVIRVFDDGRGVAPERLEQLNKSLRVEGDEKRGRHIGLYNIRERLVFLYGNEECFHIESELGKGTCVTLIMDEIY